MLNLGRKENMSRFSYNASPFGKEKAVINGLTLYPISMENYHIWLDCKPVLTLRMSTLPVRLAVMTYIEAIYAMEITSALAGQQIGMLGRFANLLCLSARIEKKEQIRFLTKDEDPLSLESVAIYPTGETEPIILTPNDFSRVREAIATLNGESLPDESENTELDSALRQKAALEGVSLDFNVSDLIDSVAYASGVRFEEIKTWTIKEFELRVKTIDRSRRFITNAIAEGFGSKWKNGNPVPDWRFNKAENELGGFSPLGETLHKVGTSEEMLNQQIKNL